MKPGIYAGITNDDYHGGPGTSKSGLDKLHRSPLHFVTPPANDNVSKALLIGTAFHTRVLEPENFDAEFVVGQKFDRRTNAGKAAAAEFEAMHAGKTVLDPDDVAMIDGMAQAVREHPAASRLLTGGEPELSAYWLDQTGELLRCRPDYWRTTDGIIVDLKSTEDASPRAFAASVANYRYHVQAAFYMDGVNEAMRQSGSGGVTVSRFVFVAVEKKPPHAVAVYELDAESFLIGRQEYRADVDMLATCRRANIWPGYGDELQPLSLPRWYKSQFTDEVEEIEVAYA